MRRARRAACRGRVAPTVLLVAVVGAASAPVPTLVGAQTSGAQATGARTIDARRGDHAMDTRTIDTRTNGLAVRVLPATLGPGPATPSPAAVARQVVDPGPSTTVATLSSLTVPGSGQLLLGQARGWIYLTLEAVGWVFWADRRAAGNGARDDYRDLAWEVARIHEGPRRDGTFGYYETLSQWTRSGAYDRDPATAGLQPEQDPTTYNGAIWQRAVGLYLPGGADDVPDEDPAYGAAVSYYDARAYATGFLWDWSGDPAARERFTELIAESDEGFRQATNVLGAILANHLVSAVDAYLSARGRTNPLEIRASPGPLPGRTRWSARLRLGTPR